VGPATETCNNDGVDEDCDGMVNENPPCACLNGQTQPCGNCNGGTSTCANGAWGACQNAPGPPVTYYRDGDGDGAGNAAATITSCTGAPSGYVSNTSDCCDTDPGVPQAVAATFRTTANACGWDWNCANGAELQYTRARSGNPCSGGTAGWDVPIPPCGGTGTFTYCGSSDGFAIVDSLTQTQGCR
jgi:hypothetical protein